MVDRKKDKSEVVIQLSDKITVQKSGEQLFSNKITLKAPSAVHMIKLCSIKQIVMSAFKTAAAGAAGAAGAAATQVSQTQQQSDTNISDADQVITVLYMNASPEEIICLMNGFRELLLAGCGLVEDVVVTEYVLSQLLVKDIELLLGEYIVNFIIPSWMQQAMKT